MNIRPRSLLDVAVRLGLLAFSTVMPFSSASAVEQHNPTWDPLKRECRLIVIGIHPEQPLAVRGALDRDVLERFEQDWQAAGSKITSAAGLIALAQNYNITRDLADLHQFLQANPRLVLQVLSRFLPFVQNVADYEDLQGEAYLQLALQMQERQRTSASPSTVLESLAAIKLHTEIELFNYLFSSRGTMLPRQVFHLFKVLHNPSFSVAELVQAEQNMLETVAFTPKILQFSTPVLTLPPSTTSRFTLLLPLVYKTIDELIASEERRGAKGALKARYMRVIVERRLLTEEPLSFRELEQLLRISRQHTHDLEQDLIVGLRERFRRLDLPGF